MINNEPSIYSIETQLKEEPQLYTVEFASTLGKELATNQNLDEGQKKSIEILNSFLQQGSQFDHVSLNDLTKRVEECLTKIFFTNKELLVKTFWESIVAHNQVIDCNNKIVENRNNKILEKNNTDSNNSLKAIKLEPSYAECCQYIKRKEIDLKISEEEFNTLMDAIGNKNENVTKETKKIKKYLQQNFEGQIEPKDQESLSKEVNEIEEAQKVEEKQEDIRQKIDTYELQLKTIRKDETKAWNKLLKETEKINGSMYNTIEKEIGSIHDQIGASITLEEYYLQRNNILDRFTHTLFQAELSKYRAIEDAVNAVYKELSGEIKTLKEERSKLKNNKARVYNDSVEIPLNAFNTDSQKNLYNFLIHKLYKQIDSNKYELEIEKRKQHIAHEEQQKKEEEQQKKEAEKRQKEEEKQKQYQEAIIKAKKDAEEREINAKKWEEQIAREKIAQKQKEEERKLEELNQKIKEQEKLLADTTKYFLTQKENILSEAVELFQKLQTLAHLVPNINIEAELLVVSAIQEEINEQYKTFQKNHYDYCTELNNLELQIDKKDLELGDPALFIEKSQLKDLNSTNQKVDERLKQFGLPSIPNPPNTDENNSKQQKPNEGTQKIIETVDEYRSVSEKIKQNIESYSKNAKKNLEIETSIQTWKAKPNIKKRDAEGIIEQSKEYEEKIKSEAKFSIAKIHESSSREISDRNNFFKSLKDLLDTEVTDETVQTKIDSVLRAIRSGKTLDSEYLKIVPSLNILAQLAIEIKANPFEGTDILDTEDPNSTFSKCAEYQAEILTLENQFKTTSEEYEKKRTLWNKVDQKIQNTNELKSKLSKLIKNLTELNNAFQKISTQIPKEEQEKTTIENRKINNKERVTINGQDVRLILEVIDKIQVLLNPETPEYQNLQDITQKILFAIYQLKQMVKEQQKKDTPTQLLSINQRKQMLEKAYKELAESIPSITQIITGLVETSEISNNTYIKIQEIINLRPEEIKTNIQTIEADIHSSKFISSEEKEDILQGIRNEQNNEITEEEKNQFEQIFGGKLKQEQNDIQNTKALTSWKQKAVTLIQQHYAILWNKKQLLNLIFSDIKGFLQSFKSENPRKFLEELIRSPKEILETGDFNNAEIKEMIEEELFTLKSEIEESKKLKDLISKPEFKDTQECTNRIINMIEISDSEDKKKTTKDKRKNTTNDLIELLESIEQELTQLNSTIESLEGTIKNLQIAEPARFIEQVKKQLFISYNRIIKRNQIALGGDFSSQDDEDRNQIVLEGDFSSQDDAEDIKKRIQQLRNGIESSLEIPSNNIPTKRDVPVQKEVSTNAVQYTQEGLILGREVQNLTTLIDETGKQIANTAEERKGATKEETIESQRELRYELERKADLITKQINTITQLSHNSRNKAKSIETFNKAKEAIKSIETQSKIITAQISETLSQLRKEISILIKDIKMMPSLETYQAVIKKIRVLENEYEQNNELEGENQSYIRSIKAELNSIIYNLTSPEHIQYLQNKVQVYKEQVNKTKGISEQIKLAQVIRGQQDQIKKTQYLVSTMEQKKIEEANSRPNLTSDRKQIVTAEIDDLNKQSEELTRKTQIVRASINETARNTALGKQIQDNKAKIKVLEKQQKEEIPQGNTKKLTEPELKEMLKQLPPLPTPAEIEEMQNTRGQIKNLEKNEENKSNISTEIVSCQNEINILTKQLQNLPQLKPFQEEIKAIKLQEAAIEKHKAEKAIELKIITLQQTIESLEKDINEAEERYTLEERGMKLQQDQYYMLNQKQRDNQKAINDTKKGLGGLERLQQNFEENIQERLNQIEKIRGEYWIEEKRLKPEEVTPLKIYLRGKIEALEHIIAKNNIADREELRVTQDKIGNLQREIDMIQHIYEDKPTEFFQFSHEIETLIIKIYIISLQKQIEEKKQTDSTENKEFISEAEKSIAKANSDIKTIQEKKQTIKQYESYSFDNRKAIELQLEKLKIAEDEAEADTGIKIHNTRVIEQERKRNEITEEINEKRKKKEKIQEELNITISNLTNEETKSRILEIKKFQTKHNVGDVVQEYKIISQQIEEEFRSAIQTIELSYENMITKLQDITTSIESNKDLKPKTVEHLARLARKIEEEAKQYDINVGGVGLPQLIPLKGTIKSQITELQQAKFNMMERSGGNQYSLLYLSELPKKEMNPVKPSIYNLNTREENTSLHPGQRRYLGLGDILSDARTQASKFIPAKDTRSVKDKVKDVRAMVKKIADQKPKEKYPYSL